MKEVELKSIAERAGRAAAAEAVYLFGSRATGLAREDSDFDFALILGDDVDPWSATLEAQRALWPREFSVDIAPISKRTWLTSRDFFVESIRRDGRLLYASDG